MKPILKTFIEGKPVCHPCGNYFGKRKTLEGGIVSTCLICGNKTGVAQAREFNLNREDLLSGGFVDVYVGDEVRQIPASLYARVIRRPPRFY